MCRSSSANEVITKPEENKSFSNPNTEKALETTSAESDLVPEATVQKQVLQLTQQALRFGSLCY